MRKFIEFLEDYWFNLSQPECINGIFIASCVAAVITSIIIF